MVGPGFLFACPKFGKWFFVKIKLENNNVKPSNLETVESGQNNVLYGKNSLDLMEEQTTPTHSNAATTPGGQRE